MAVSAVSRGANAKALTLVAALALCGGCATRLLDQPPALVEVVVTAGPSLSDATVGEIQTIELVVSGAATSVSTHDVAGKFVSRVVAFVYRATALDGAIEIDVLAHDAAGRTLATGTAAAVALASGVETRALVALAAPVEVADLGADLAHLDLATPDLAPSDLAVPDLAMPDLAMPDLAMPDLAMPDLTPPCARPPDPVRLISPLSTALVASQRPTLRWTSSGA